MLGDIKIDVVRHLASHAPSVLLDAVCAVPRVIDEAALPRDVALLIGLDASGYDTSPEGHRLSCFPRASMRGAFGRWARSAAN